MNDALVRHQQAYAYCAYCPKACRFACPVSESTHSETTSTWGKMSTAFFLAQGTRPLDEDGARALYACTGCMRCRTFCKHQNEVGFALFSARAEALEKAVAPEGVSSTVRTFHEHGNPFGVDLAPVVASFHPEAPVRYPLFTGCTALAKAKGLIEDAIAVGQALSAPMGVSKVSTRCCGYPLYAAGDLEGFAAHATKLAESLRELPELVVLDPGCAYTLQVVYPRMGFELGTRVRTIYEVFASHLEHAPARPKLPIRAAYHDSCKLGRGLGQYEEPRALLRAAVQEVREGAFERAEAGCSGGGGLLPRSHPEVAVDIARRQAQQLAPEGELLVSACPTSRRMFERAGRRAMDLVSVLRSWLVG